MPDSTFINLAIAKHEPILRDHARYIAGNYEPPMPEEKVYEMLVDAIRNGRADIIKAWRIGFFWADHLPLDNPAYAGLILEGLITLHKFMRGEWKPSGFP